MRSRRGRSRRLATGLLAPLVALGLLAGCGTLLPQDDGDTVTLDFFQFKREAVETFDKLIAGFEAENPGIEVKQYQAPQPDTDIRARIVKNNFPDVMTLNGNSVFGELASAGVFHDFSAERVVDSVNPDVMRVLDDLGTNARGEHNGLPLASNASGVVYNKDLFAEHAVQVPTTWDELMAAAETFERAGVTPFYGALQEATTPLHPFNQLAGSLTPENFFEERRDGEASFTEGFEETAQKLAAIYDHTQKDAPARNYDAGNQAFAQGKSAMYAAGSYTLPALKAYQPDFEMGLFTMPGQSDAKANKLVSGVDVALTMPREAEHPEESLAFINYLMRPDVVTDYAAQQSAIPTLREMEPSDPVLKPLIPYFTEGRITGFVDHQIPLAVRLDALLQEFLLGRDLEKFLRNLDNEYEEVLRRRG